MLQPLFTRESPNKSTLLQWEAANEMSRIPLQTMLADGAYDAINARYFPFGIYY